MNSECLDHSKPTHFAHFHSERNGITVYEKEGVLYEIISDCMARLHGMTNYCSQLIVPSEIVSSDSEKYKVVGFSNGFVPYVKISEPADVFSFDESSEVEEVPMHLIFSVKSCFFLPPRIKRVTGSCFEQLTGVTIVSSNNKFVSIIGKKSIMNHHPLEIKNQFFHRSHLSIRETTQVIGKCAFIDNKQLVSVVVPSSVEVIEVFAFSGCRNLRSITFKPNSKLRKIRDAFSQTSISIFHVPSSVHEIDTKAFHFHRCLSLIKFNKDSMLKIIRKTSFSNSNIKSIEFPPSVEIIEPNAFINCLNLCSIVFPSDSKLKFIGDHAFESVNIISIDFPSSLEAIGSYAFESCFCLRSMSFPEESKLKTIGERAFGNTRLESVDFPLSIEEIGERSFFYCQYLSSINFHKDSKLKKIGNGAFAFTDIRALYIPPSVEEICDWAFGCNDSLISVYFSPKSRLKTIGRDIFNNSSRISISVPNEFKERKIIFGSNIHCIKIESEYKRCKCTVY